MCVLGSGGGVRSRPDVAPADVLGALCMVVPTTGVWAVSFCLASCRSSSRGSARDWSTAASRRASRRSTRQGAGLEDALVMAWATLQGEVTAALGAVVDTRPLGVEAACAGMLDGAPINKVQRALTLQREETRVPWLRRALGGKCGV